MFVERAAAAEVEVAVEFGAGVLFDNVEDFEGFGHDFGPDVVAWEDDDVGCFGGEG